MPIIIGPSKNLPKIILGKQEMKEAYIGKVLIWQNNLPPVYTSLTWDGTNISVPSPFEAFSGSASSETGPYNGSSSETRNISLLVGTITDPDNSNPDYDGTDYIVGYRLKHPDGSYIAGDPKSTGNRSDGAPIADYGDILPGTSSTWNSTDEEFTSGTTALSSNISIPISAYQDIDHEEIVDSSDHKFYDAGNYELIIVDSRAGESERALIEITLKYQEPTGNARSGSTNISTNASSPTSFTNATIGGPSSTTLSYNPTGGPSTSNAANEYLWTCVSGCSNSTSTNSTYTVAIPQDPSGNATPARVRLQILGRSWEGNNVTERTTIGDFYFRSGAACSAGYSVSDSSYSLSNGCAVYGGTPSPASGATTVSCSGDCTSFSGGGGKNYSGTFSRPYPGCPPGGSPQTATVSVSGGSISIGGSLIGISTGSRSYTGSTPSASYECLAQNGSGTYSNSGARAFASSSTCTDTTPATMDVSGNASCRVLDPRPGGPACGTASNPSTSCGSVAVSCSGVPRNGQSTSSTSCPGTTTTAPNTTVTLQTPGTFEWNAGSKALCYSGTIVFAGVSTHRIGGAVSITWTCTGDNNDVETIRRNEGTSGHGPGAWTETDFGTDCEAFSSQAAGSSISCTGELRYFISGWGNVTASVGSQTIST